MALVLYDYPKAPSPRRARIFLAEKKAPFEHVLIDLMAGDHLKPEFRAINPNCTVPALRLEDGTVLTENAGIACYLEAVFAEPPLLGVTPVEKGLVATWNARVEFEGLLAVAEAMRNTAPAMRNRSITGPLDFPQIPELAVRGRRRVEAFFETLERRLEGRHFLAIDGFSQADITAVVAVDFARVLRLQPGAEHPNLARWRAALADRPSLAA